MARRGAALRASLIAVTVAVVLAAAQVRIGWLLANRAAQARADASPSRTPGEAPAGQLTRRGLGGLFSAHRVAAAAGDGRSSAGTLRLACPRRALRSRSGARVRAAPLICMGAPRCTCKLPLRSWTTRCAR